MTNILADSAVFWIILLLPTIMAFMFDRRLRWWILWTQLGSFVLTILIWLIVATQPEPEPGDAWGAIIISILIPGLVSLVLFPVSLIPWKKKEED